MPAIANPYRGRRVDVPSPDSAGAHRSYSLPVRIRTAIHRDALTRELAEGADPTASPERALRAARLTGGRRRRAIARTLRRTVDEARQPIPTRAHVVIINRREVLEAQDAITAMIQRLASPAPVHAQGVAMAERILANAERSPLYNDSEPGTLRRLIGIATLAMDTEAGESHEFPIAA